MNTVDSQRLYYLDAVRAFALLMGVVFHASLSFMPVFIGWAVMDISTSDWIDHLVLVSHSFRMPLFFLIAGFFTHMAIQKNGAKAFFKSRLFRIGVPFIAGWVVLYPLIASGWVIGAQSLRGDVNITEGMRVGLQSLLQPNNGFFVGTHLWFLYYLLLITAAVVCIRALFKIDLIAKLDAQSNLYRHLIARADKITTWLCASFSGLFTLVSLTGLCLWFMQGWGLDTPDKSLVPHLPVFIVYGGCFLLGYCMHRQQGLIEQFSGALPLKLVVCVISIGASVVLAKYQLTPNNPSISTYKALFSFAYAVMMWSLIMLIIGTFRMVFRRSNKVVSYLSDASYWLYLIHLPIVIWLQVAFAELAMHWSLKLGLICLITVGLSLLLYDGLVRSTVIGKLLNGKLKARRILPQR